LIKRYLDGLDRALFSDGPGAFIALALACALWAIELVANIRGDSGWAYWAHLLTVGPLWSFLFLLLVRGLWRRRRSCLRNDPGHS